MVYARLADTIRNALGLDELASPFAYAVRLLLDLVPDAHAIGGADLIGRQLRWDASMPAEAQRAAVGREICRWLLRVRNDPENAETLRVLYGFMFPFCAPPEFSALRSAQHLRLLPPSRVQPQSAASPIAHFGRLPEPAARPR